LTADGITANTTTRNTGAQWAVTSENEWYKAAYYKGGGASSGYWQYPTSSDTPPGRNIADPWGNNANYFNGVGEFPIDSPYFTTLVGEFQNSASPYGTFDQGGNLYEWNESIISEPYYRGLRGSSFSTVDNELRSAVRNYLFPDYELPAVGFRVSQIPGPSSVALLAIGGLVTARRRRS
jgi:formylglycine-generating enzyme required for sulfatase activity